MGHHDIRAYGAYRIAAREPGSCLQAMSEALRQPLPPSWGQPWAWLVTTAEGWRAVFIDHATADKYAAVNHGSVTPLYPRQ